MMRADIDGDFAITSVDGYLLDNYIERIQNSTIPPPPFPAPATNPYLNIGTRFNVIRLRVEEFVDRNDDYAANPNTSAQSSILHKIFLTMMDIYLTMIIFSISNCNVIYTAIGMGILLWLLQAPSQNLFLLYFTTESGFTQNSCIIDGVQCNVYPVPPQLLIRVVVDFFIPNNLIIGDGGELQRPDGDFYKVDFEVGTIVLEIPDGLFGSERTIDIMTDFIVDYTGNGATRLGFPSMRFADCSFVTARRYR